MNDFETHPIGTAERLRRLDRVGPRAADLIEEFADDLKESETVDGEWTDQSDTDARDTYDAWRILAAVLRAACRSCVR